MKRLQRYVLGFVAVLAFAGCSSHHHHGMASEGRGDAYWQKGQQDMASLIDRTVKDQGKAEQVKSVVSEIVAELKASREQERAGHRRLYELNANYAATPEEFTKILALRFKMKEFMTVEEWKALSEQMLAYSGRYRHSESAPRTSY